jgi:hypothetical protein
MNSLICEGPCNPNIDAIDALAAAYWDARKRAAAFDTRDLFTWQRALEYRPHVDTGLGYRCVACGTSRRFGR